MLEDFVPLQDEPYAVDEQDLYKEDMGILYEELKAYFEDLPQMTAQLEDPSQCDSCFTKLKIIYKRLSSIRPIPAKLLIQNEVPQWLLSFLTYSIEPRTRLIIIDIISLYCLTSKESVDSVLDFSVNIFDQLINSLMSNTEMQIEPHVAPLFAGLSQLSKFNVQYRTQIRSPVIVNRIVDIMRNFKSVKIEKYALYLLHRLLSPPTTSEFAQLVIALCSQLKFLEEDIDVLQLTISCIKKCFIVDPNTEKSIIDSNFFAIILAVATNPEQDFKLFITALDALTVLFEIYSVKQYVNESFFNVVLDRIKTCDKSDGLSQAVIIQSIRRIIQIDEHSFLMPFISSACFGEIMTINLTFRAEIELCFLFLRIINLSSDDVVDTIVDNMIERIADCFGNVEGIDQKQAFLEELNTFANRAVAAMNLKWIKCLSLDELLDYMNEASLSTDEKISSLASEFLDLNLLQYSK